MKYEILTTADAAKILRLSKMQIRMMVREGVLPAYKEGRKGGNRILKSDIEKYVIDRYREGMKDAKWLSVDG